jgi:predicted molibdopterin-dependent oxidoreductase YjgC
MNLTINNREIWTDKAVTLLEAALQNDIYIPSLCAHPELTPYGGCRLCIIEIEGRRGYPTACTTQAEEGMIVRTESQTLQEMRRELIQLILSEHPSACLICGDVDGCAGFQETIRKVGVTTGCRWCPQDKDCELQKIVDYLNISELSLPGLYRNLPVEKYDPYFDRDYNLCIYCGRCVRICNEHRKSSVLSFRQRGKLTTIGPAYEKSHIDADCEFCGACVSVCPTGAMSEKSRKWWGVPEKFEPSVCPLCSMNCELQVLTLKDKIVGTVPPGKPHESGGELCVKGRFCLSEIVSRSERMLEPEFLYPEGYGIVKWNFAIEKAKEIIKEIPPGRSAVFVSPGLTLEEIYAARYFAENILETDIITSSCMDSDLTAYMQLANKGASVQEMSNAGMIVSFFLNGHYRYAPLTMAIKNAASKGVPYYQIGWLKDTTSRFARKRLIPGKDGEKEMLDSILSSLVNGNGKSQGFNALTDALRNNHQNFLIIGPEIMSLNHCKDLLETIHKIAVITDSRLILPNPYGNLYGLLSLVQLRPLSEVNEKIVKGEIDLLYFIGDATYHQRPGVKHLIYQNAFPPPAGLNPDLALPTSLWGETGGSYLSQDGTIKKVVAVAIRPGYTYAHEEILSKVAEAMGIQGSIPVFEKIEKTEIHLPDDELLTDKGQTAVSVNDLSSGLDYPYLLVQEKDQHKYSNFSLGKGLSGFGELVKQGQVQINPTDAGEIGLSEGDTITLTSVKEEKRFKVSISKNIEKGFLFLVASDGDLEYLTNPCPVLIRRENV